MNKIDLKFGTGGLRAKLGDGPSRMNAETVKIATQGLAAYIKQSSIVLSVAIAYDSRLKSDVFALEAARVLSGNGINALLFPRLMPTPALSFAVRHHGCSAGICITASHNPAEYNGYKVYGPDGGQITDEAAQSIQTEINCVDGVETNDDHIAYIPESTIDAYIDAVRALRLEEPSERLSVVHTPLNGAGLECVSRILSDTDLTVVPEQKEPDGHFPTCPYPNPEEPEALRLGIALCRDISADLLLATDPDCDRAGVAVRNGDEYTILSGNEIGVLLFDYICRKRENMPERPLAVKTIVTTGMALEIAGEYGIELADVLTGFKYIGEKISQNEERFIFGFEESYGYLSGTHVRDKDAVNAALLITDMARDYKARGMNLAQGMEALYQKYGYYVNHLDSNECELEKMRKIMHVLRINPPQGSIDYLKSTTGLPPSDVVSFGLGGGRVTVRPSGTEPKIKIYYEAKASSRPEAETIVNAMRAAMRDSYGV